MTRIASPPLPSLGGGRTWRHPGSISTSGVGRPAGARYARAGADTAGRLAARRRFRCQSCRAPARFAGRGRRRPRRVRSRPGRRRDRRLNEDRQVLGAEFARAVKATSARAIPAADAVFRVAPRNVEVDADLVFVDVVPAFDFQQVPSEASAASMSLSRHRQEASRRARRSESLPGSSPQRSRRSSTNSRIRTEQ